MNRGRWGERWAAGYLRRQGFTLIGANVRSRYGEIDVIAEKDGVVAFVEVKLRSGRFPAEPREFVDRRKQARIRATASLWLAEQARRDWQPRFDVMEIYATASDPPQVTRVAYWEDAFQ